MKIDLNKLDDELKGDWFHHIRTSDFGFLMKLAGIEKYEVEKDDIIIHKEIKEGEDFPTIRYNVIKDKGSHVADKNEVKEILGKILIEYVKKNKKLPFACKFKKFFKNGAAQIDYNPSQYDKFPIKIVPKDHGYVQGLQGDGYRGGEFSVCISQISAGSKKEGVYRACSQ